MVRQNGLPQVSLQSKIDWAGWAWIAFVITVQYLLFLIVFFFYKHYDTSVKV